MIRRFFQIVLGAAVTAWTGLAFNVTVWGQIYLLSIKWFFSIRSNKSLSGFPVYYLNACTY